LAYLNCGVLGILTGAGEVNATIRLLVALFNPPSAEECVARGLSLPSNTGKAASARVRTHSTSGKGFALKLLGSKHSAFGQLANASGGGR
jgi:hypothetical protein